MQSSIFKTSKFHTLIKKITNPLINDNSHNTCQSKNYIKNLILFEKIKKLKNKKEEISSEIKVIDDALNKMVKLRTKILGSDIVEPLNIFSCPSCEQKMRIPKNKMVKVTGAKCKYRFVVDTLNTKFKNDYNFQLKTGLFKLFQRA